MCMFNCVKDVLDMQTKVVVDKCLFHVTLEVERGGPAGIYLALTYVDFTAFMLRCFIDVAASVYV